MRRIAVACLKGGSSKTTTATALAVGLARRGKRVLAIDIDGQANATWLLTGGQGAESPTLAEVLTREASASEAIRPSSVPGLDLLPSSSSLGAVNVKLAQELSRDTRLRSALASVEDDYDIAVLDSGPSFTSLLANALVWASEVIVPADPGVFAVLGLVELEGVMAEVREAYGNNELHLAGLVLTRVARNNVHRDVEASLRASYGDRVFKATIPLSTVVEQAHTRAQTVMEFSPKSPAALAYDALVTEILEHGRTKEVGSGKHAGRGSRTKPATQDRIAG
jgi:chromosome partitioning protein